MKLYNKDNQSIITVISILIDLIITRSHNILHTMFTQYSQILSLFMIFFRRRYLDFVSQRLDILNRRLHLPDVIYKISEISSICIRIFLNFSKNFSHLKYFPSKIFDTCIIHSSVQKCHFSSVFPLILSFSFTTVNKYILPQI